MQALDHAGAARRRVNPRQARDFARATGRLAKIGQLAKTDQVDAAVLAEMGRALALTPDAPSDGARDRLALLSRRLEVLKDMEKIERQRLKPTLDAYLRRDIAAVRRCLAKRIKALEAGIARLIEGEPELAEAERLIRSAPGIGPILAHRILAYLPEMGTLDRRAAASLAGLAPHACDSGHPLGPLQTQCPSGQRMRGRRIIWGGRTEARRALFLAAFIATRYDPAMKAFRQRLQEAGKTPKVAIIAAARKMATILNAMLKTGKPYDLSA